MRRLLKSWVFWAFVAVPAAVTTAGLVHSEHRGWVCDLCFTERWQSRWRIGVRGKASWPVWPTWGSVFESNVHKDGWAEAHEHRWHQTGLGRREPFAYAGSPELLGRYEGYAEFRAFMLAKRGRGELAREDFLAALEFPSGAISCGRPIPEELRLRRERMDLLVAEFLHKAYRP